ncbi:hypothetical protein O181_083168 [Austropuccinia psidii MF-1]|uniref:Reverse transcriptase domain-containing protein n=1 Tax=Austropuccinia psidii MF-1 TaxID=1389203 RepID=A0A9Q3FNV8_9BASI|nr:hypothetical protein [Austropuccinia psidii MF-1]
MPSQSSLKSRDEVFKEIKDVGEDVAISSIHLFQGDMDLPPLSFHASLEEKWDEEEKPEEIETVLKKTDGGLHLCVEYRNLNAVTRKNRYPVPPMNQLLTVFNGSTIFSKIYLHGAYNLLRIKEGDEYLASFRTKYSSYEYFVMPLRLTNAAAYLQNLVNVIFADFLDIFVVVYLDDIMVFSSSEEEHVKHVASVLQRLRDNNLFAKASKSNLQLSSAQEHQSSSIFSWLFQFQLSFHQKLLQKNNCSHFPSQKDSPLNFNEKALSQFQILKEAFNTAPILSHFNPSLQTIVETESSDYSWGAVLSQVNDSGKNPIAFDSCNLLPAELNYEIHDKVLLGIVWGLMLWRAFLLSLSNPFEVLTDNSSLQYFKYSKALTHFKAHWAEFLSEFHFTITYGPGRLVTLLDALSRQDNMYPEGDGFH